MARTPTQVQESMIDTVASIDPTIQIEGDPIEDVIITPAANEISTVEGEVDSLENLYSNTFISGGTATAAQVTAWATNFACNLPNGYPSTGFVTFATYSPLQPGETVTIPVGTLVANVDGSLIYSVTTAGTITGDNLSAFFNASNNWYEITLPVAAINNGPQFDLAPNRIKQLQTPITGSNGASVNVVLNRKAIGGGLASANLTQAFTQVQNAFTGQDSGSQNGLVKLIQNYDPNNILGVALVRSSERDLFLRYVNQLAMDVYINGSVAAEQVDTITLQNNQSFVIPILQPLISINAVYVNGTLLASTAYSLEADTGILQGSTKAQDMVVFTQNYPPGTVIEVDYNYNVLLTNVLNNVFAPEDDDLFAVDILVREMQTNLLIIQGTIQISSSATYTTVLTNTQAALLALIENNVNGAVYEPSIIEQTLVNSVVGLAGINFTMFTSESNGTLDVQIVSLNKNQIAEIDQTQFVIS